MLSRLFTICCAILMVFIQCQLQINPLSSVFIDEIKNKALSELIHPTSCEQAYSAVKILSLQHVSEFQCGCDEISSLITKTTTLNVINPYDTYYAIEVSKACKCNTFKPSQAIVDAITLASKEDSLLTFVGAALALKAMNKPLPIDKIISHIKPLSQTSGLMKSSSAEDTKESIEHVSNVLYLLATYSDSKGDMKDFVERFTKLLPSSEDDMISDPMLFGNIIKISEKKPKLSSAALLLIGELLLQQILSPNLSTVAIALDSLYLLSEYNTAPLFVNMDKISIPFEEPTKIIKFDVLNIVGKPAKAQHMEIKSLKLINQSESLFNGGIAIDGKTLDLSSFDLKIGRYEMDLVVTIDGRSVTVNIKKYFTVTDHLVISDILAGMTDSKQTSLSDLTSIFRENGLTDVEGSGLETDVFHVAFTLKTQSKSKFIKPHQVFVRFHHKDSHTDTFFYAKAIRSLQESTGYIYRVVISLADEMDTFLNLSGEFTVDILAGDVSYETSLQHIIGTVVLKFPPKTISDGPLYTKSLLHTSDNTLVPLPEIEHQMRPPAKRASMFMATVFTILAVLPLVILIGFILTKTPNLSRLGNISALLFLFTLIGILALYLGYWFALPGFSFYETIRYMLILLPITYIIGRSAMTTITESRTVEVTQNKKKD